MIHEFRLVASKCGGRSARSSSSGVILFCMVLASAVLITSCSKMSTSEDGSTGSTYTLGKRVSFGESGDSERFRVAGWSATEKAITWTEGSAALLQFAGIPASSSVRLKMTLAGFVNPPGLQAQTVEVLANGKKVATWEVAGKAEFSALIPPRPEGEGDSLKIELNIPKAASPKTLGVSDDVRVLGVSCFDLVLNKVE